MKKEIIISFVVIVLVIVGNFITQNYTKQCTEKMNEYLAELETEITKQDKDEKKIENKANIIKDDWDNMQEKLSYYIEHDELEKVETQLFLLAGEAKSKLYQDAVPEIEKCIFILEHIEDKTALNIKNIF